jgi:DNA-binding NtrC family response regulator
VEHFVRQFCGENNFKPKAFTPAAMDALRRHAWRGNVRELRNVLERGAVVARTPVIQLEDLGLPAKGAAQAEAAQAGAAPLQSLDDVERKYICSVLASTGGNVSASARILGIDRVTLYNKMRKYGVQRDGEPLDVDAEPPRRG